jgi:phospholipase C
MKSIPNFWIAQEWGFANYMFQTNQGPSFPAHQFLFSGTAAPVTDGSSWQGWFASENPYNNVGSPSGCWASTAELVEQVTNVGSYPYAESYTGWVPTEVTLSGGGAPPAGYPCYHHNSIATLLDGANPPISWKYYTNDKTSVWTAPTAIWDICKPNANNVNAPNTVPGPCQGPDYLNGSVYQEVYSSTPPNSAAQIYNDIQSCSLPAVTFVTPDGAWSDHAGSGSTVPYAYGPSWVANLINIVGGATTCDGTGGYWADTVILVTWDDWGGWYDHVAPPEPCQSGVLEYSNCVGQNNVYGFRVPLLVVSGYSVVAGKNPPTYGYVSGAWTSGPQPTTCPGPPYCHDFGSILNFIEYVFGSNGHHLGPISPNYLYADSLVLDTDPSHLFSLSDFFNFRLTTPNPFYSVPNIPYPASFFTGYTGAALPPDLD